MTMQKEKCLRLLSDLS